MSAIRRVLLVEDHLAVSEMLGEHLKLAGMEVINATTVAEGESQFTQNSIDAVVVDGTLQEPLDGVKMVKFARERHFTGPIVGISGFHNRELCEAGATIGVSKSRGTAVVGAIDYFSFFHEQDKEQS